jgi:hypothetical protein
MRWTPDDGERDWHAWFAWYPVELPRAAGWRTGGDRVWLQWVERKTHNVQGYLINSYRLSETSGVTHG